MPRHIRVQRGHLVEQRVRRSARRRFTAIAAVGVMLAANLVGTAAPAAAASPNLIVNGGFEDGLDGWFPNDFDPSNLATLSVTDDAHSGAGAVLVTDRTNTPAGPMQDIAGKLQAGKSYAATAWVRYDDPDGPPTKEFVITVHFGGSNYNNIGRVTVPRGQWGLLQGGFAVPAGQSVTTARIFVETAWNPNPETDPDLHLMDFAVDDVTLVEYEPATTIEVLGKIPGDGNPLLSHKFTADGYGFVHDGRVYVYLTHDHQMFVPGPDGTIPTNTYGGINTLTVISSDDLVNWVDHGEIPVAGPSGIAPYASQSWAPSIESKVVDGVEKFFLYFANSGGATGVLVGDSPLGPWHDDRSSLLITSATPGASNGRNWLFDPGVFIDHDGKGYLYFGGGGDDGSGSWENTNRPKSTRVIRLGDDMISTVGSAEVIDAPLVFEASHVFERAGKYYYSYSSNFGHNGPVDPAGPPTGAIAYLMADNPMGPWTPETYAGVIFRNPGEFFGVGGNNHQSIFEFNGQYYFTYHAQTVNQRVTGGATQGFRSPHIAKLEFNTDGTIQEVIGTYDGVDQFRHVDPYRVIEAETIAWQQGITTKKVDGSSAEFGVQAPNVVLHDVDNGDWTSLSSVDFGSRGAASVTAKVRPLAAGGRIQVRLGDRTAPVIATIPVGGPLGEWTELTAQLDGVTGVHDVYFTYAGPAGANLFEVDSWTFTAAPAVAVSATASTRCLGGKAQLEVTVANDAPARVTGSVATPFGTKEYGVQSGSQKARTFPTNAARVPAGTATVTATARVNGEPVEATLRIPYGARSCG